jgi:hypothetical protein
MSKEGFHSELLSLFVRKHEAAAGQRHNVEQKERQQTRFLPGS